MDIDSPDRSWMGRWAGFVRRTAWAWIIGWPVLGVVVWLGTPRISSLLTDSARGFLPPDMPSQRAAAELRRAFPDHAFASRAVVVLARRAGLTAADRAYMTDVGARLEALRARRGWRVTTPTSAPWLAPILESPDGAAAVVTIDLPAEMFTHHAVASVALIRRTLAESPPPTGLAVELTGDAALGDLLARGAKRNVDDTTFWAFLSVGAILLFIYRSPVAMALPILTIASSLLTSLGLIGWAGARGLPVSGLVEMFTIVVVVGSGVDYCLFLFARFREEMARAPSPPDAVVAAVSRCGGAILASAGTNVAGLGTLILARNRDIYTTGPTIAFAICVATLAVLTLAPALMCVAGNRLLWPAVMTGRPPRPGRFWTALGRRVVAHPGRISAVTLGVLVIPSVVAVVPNSLYDTLDEYPPDTSFVRGARLAYRHFFGTDHACELTLILTAEAPLRGPAERALREALVALRADLRATLPVLYIRDMTDPLGTEGAREPFADYDDAIVDFAVPFISAAAKTYYVSASGRSARVDVGLDVEPRSLQAVRLLERLRALAERHLAAVDWSSVDVPRVPEVNILGEPAVVADLRALKAWDFVAVAVAAVVVIFAILLWLLRAWMVSGVLVAATLLTFSATYGATWAIFHGLTGLSGLNWRLDFLLFIILLSLGQDYNIYVVTRMREEMRRHPPGEAIAVAVARTGGVVSSCGVIMAATFASMAAGSLLVMKQMAVALALGILVDTFIVRPLLIPSVVLLLARRTRPLR